MAGGSKKKKNKEKGSSSRSNKASSSKPKNSGDENFSGGNPFEPGTKNYKVVQHILRAQFERSGCGSILSDKTVSQKGSGDRRLNAMETVTISGIRELVHLYYNDTDKNLGHNLLCSKPIPKGPKLKPGESQPVFDMATFLATCKGTISSETGISLESRNAALEAPTEHDGTDRCKNVVCERLDHLRI